MVYEYKIIPTERITNLINKIFNSQSAQTYVDQLNKNKLYENLQNDLKQNDVSYQVKL